ncbi:helicase-related protein [Hydrogenimonas cancrithermarum]|uniref:ATP-dependent helicase HepA n=1 Tax=Hydrogenimonas cancrithermarum TaxID=2993563 RepID=A0ABN6WZX7_9BACT|nr:helicase-related protein [Hydrogenimonas cancrithermarum]BDY13967.1 ATP-dependent helicase HepA [Hydrogenimonas cancrithermarum]
MSVMFQPGSIVTARSREWIVLPNSTPEVLHLRPVGGSEFEATRLHIGLEKTPIRHAIFPWPSEEEVGPSYAALLLKDAMMLKMRSGAGPFRSFGNIAIEPRAYQLVPLMIAMKQETIRLLIADDVGIGKTIEAGLIVRELLDRGEIDRFTVLAPPHLCEQWQEELKNHFHIDATIVRTSTVGRLERSLPPGRSIFEAYPFTVVSLDYIKSDRRRDEFLRSCPKCVIVDEAHTCTQGSTRGRQKRYELLKDLSKTPDRHMILLTATPHSGDDAAFHNLLGLLDPVFRTLGEVDGAAKQELRQKLALHFVQRRRPDIEEWHDQNLFPEKLSAEVTYKLSGEWGKLFDDVLEYAREIVESVQDQSQHRQRLTWWAALALLRCVSSSPMAAVAALRTRIMAPEEDAEFEDEMAKRVLDGTEDDLSTEDIEPAAATDENREKLQDLMQQALALTTPSKDPKLKTLIKQLGELIDEGFRPVIFCRYIATAHYVADALKKKFKSCAVETVTGELTPKERQERVEALGMEPQPILVATDCLSEGINLQEYFTAVVHYDLSWNPTRHEQREGRVDRFGQKAKEVRTVMLYGQNNPIDGAVLDVILRKAESIKKELGILVPMPDDENRITQALMRAVLFKKRDNKQLTLELFDEDDELADLTTRWESAYEKAKQNRTIFAQRGLKPADILPEWEKSRAALGSEEEVERFVSRIAMALDAPLEKREKGDYSFYTHHLPETLRELLKTREIEGELRIDFHYPAKVGAGYIHRTSPLVTVLADYAAESALQEAWTPWIARASVYFTDAVEVKTTLALARLRTRLTLQRQDKEHTMLCEEMLTFEVGESLRILHHEEQKRYFDAEPVKNMPTPIQKRHLSSALKRVKAKDGDLDALAKERARILLEDHRRIRDASKARGSYSIAPVLPVDILGVIVLVPASKER